MKPGNFEFKMLACGEENFARAFGILFAAESNYGKERTVEAYMADVQHGLTLFTYYHASDKEVMKLPYKMSKKAAFAFAWNWLKSNEANESRGNEPDIDGSTHPDAFEISSTHYGDTIQIKPCWSEYHK